MIDDGAIAISGGGMRGGVVGGRCVKSKKCLLGTMFVVQICFIACFWLVQQQPQETAASNKSNNNYQKRKQSVNENSVNDIITNVNATVAAKAAVINEIIAHKASASNSDNNIQLLNRKLFKVQFVPRIDEQQQASSTAAATKKKQPASISVMPSQPLRSLPSYQGAHCKRYSSINNFTKDFKKLASSASTRLIISDDGVTDGKWCFRKGTANLPTINKNNMQQQCICQPQWHGSDCSQPEVVWRALMTAKRTFNWMKPTTTNMQQTPHRLTLLVEGNFFSKELLELQLQILADVVDDIIILVRRMDVQPHELRILARKVMQVMNNSEKTENSGDNNNHSNMIIHCTNSTGSSTNSHKRWHINMASIYGNCTAMRACEKYAELCPFANIASDLFVYAEEFDLLAPQALQFFKYYGGIDMPILRFRLKYNVYGFYWQHPQRTRLSGLLSSFAQLQHPKLGQGDPQRLIQLTTHTTINGRRQQKHSSGDNNNSWFSLVIGDLNHFGGWYCLYCQQPREIIDHLNESHLQQLRLHQQHSKRLQRHQKLQQESSLNKNAKSHDDGANDQKNASSDYEHLMVHIQLPNNTHNNLIDIEYVQKLIANGVYLNDGHTQLQKLHNDNNNKYAPKYAEKCAWKFSHLLVNIFDSFDNDMSYEELL